MEDKIKLSPAARDIFDRAMAVVQEAEELQGPADYGVLLAEIMADIVARLEAYETIVVRDAPMVGALVAADEADIADDNESDAYVLAMLGLGPDPEGERAK